MNIQIFGTKKSFDSKKAERYFKERRIKYQYIDMKEKGLSKGELASVAQAVGGLDALIDPDCKDAQLVALVKYLAPEQRMEKVLENQQNPAHPHRAQREAGHRGLPARRVEGLGVGSRRAGLGRRGAWGAEGPGAAVRADSCLISESSARWMAKCLFTDIKPESFSVI